MRKVLRYFERWFQEVWSFELTSSGKVMLGAIAFSATGSAMTLLAIPVYHLLTGLLGIYVVSYAISMLFRPRLKVIARIPTRATVGQSVECSFSLTNRSRLPAYDVETGFFNLPEHVRRLEHSQTVPSLRRGERTTLGVKIMPRRRGLHALGGYRAYSTFPLNFHRRGGMPQRTASLLVLPSFHPLSEVHIPVGRRHQPGGIALTSQVGESPEYIGNRDYRPGDSTRRICFKSWARVARPVVREYQEEYYCRIAMVLDTSVPSGRRRAAQGAAALESAVSMTAAVASALSNGEYIIDLFAAGPEMYVFRSGRHLAHLENLLEILACVEPSGAKAFETVGPALEDELGRITTVVFVMLDWDDARRRLVRQAVYAGCSVKVLIIRDGPTTQPIEPDENWCDRIAQHTTREVDAGEIDRV